MSQQQNPPSVSQSQLPQMDSENTNTEADVKPFSFSIRQYAYASRQKDIFNSWPFPEEYLHMCVNQGITIKDVLPPMPLAEPLNGCSNLMHLGDVSKDSNFCKAEVPHLIEHPQNIKNECHLLSNGERYKVTDHNQDSPSSPNHVHMSSPTLASFKAMKDKRKRGRGRCKKRSMVDILATARHCTLEEINKMNQFCYTDHTVIEGSQQINGRGFIQKSWNEDHEVAN